MLLPVYLIFLGVEPTKTFAYMSAGFIVFIAFLLVSRLPVYSGKRIRMSRHMALPWLLGAVVFVLFLAYYTWETLALAALAYLLLLPIGAKAYSRRAKAEEAAERAVDEVCEW